MRTHRILSVFMLLLFVIPSALAVWDPSTELIEVRDEDVIPLSKGLILRVLESWEQGIFVSLERDGRVIASDEVTLKKPFTVTETAIVTYYGRSPYDIRGIVSRIQVHEWADGEFSRYHFPKSLNTRTLYDVFAVVKNTGKKTTRYIVELTQPGEYVKRSDRYEYEGILWPRMLEVQRPQLEVTLAPGEEKMVTYENVMALRRRPLRGTPIERAGDVLLNLYVGGNIVDEILIPRVEIVTTQSGYLSHVRMPNVLTNDHPEEIELDVVNAGPASGGIERSKFNVNLRTKGFLLSESHADFKTAELQVLPDQLRGDLPAYLSKTWKAQITPYVKPGHYNLQFDLDLQGKIFDTYIVPVEVREGSRVRIDRVTTEESANLGDILPVTVSVTNDDIGRTVVVRLTGPMIEVPLEHHLQLESYEQTDVNFEVEAIGQGKERITAELLHVPTYTTKNFDPYTAIGYSITEKSTLVTVNVPEGVVPPYSAPTSSVAGTPTSTAPKTTTPPPTPAVSFSAPEVTEQATWDTQQAGPVMIVALVILILLVAMKLIFYYTE